MLTRTFAALFCLLTLGLPSAHAHFLWIDAAAGDNGQPQARLYFSETPAPGEPHLIGKIAHAKAWVRDANGKRVELKLGTPDEEAALLPLAGEVAGAASLETFCDYGIYERGPAGLLLQYYSKCLSGDWAKHADKPSRTDGLELDIVPTLEGGKLTLEVVYQGKPAPGGEVIVVGPNGDEQQFTADEQGRVTANAGSPGKYAVRAARIEADKAGERDGKKYAQTWHYCTLLVDVRGSAAPAASDSAVDALRRARQERAVWEDFPGYTTDLVVTSGDEKVTAKATIDASGVVELDMPESKLADWVEEQLSSLVQHRMPDGEVSEGDVKWAEENDDHPLGRLVSLGDTAFSSAYRLKDDVIMEVNRSAGPAMRFTISVLEIERNAENKYLPRAFTMNFFNAKSGALQNSLGYWNEWTRVGKFDLPKTILEVDAHPGGTTTRQIVFSNCKLIEQK